MKKSKNRNKAIIVLSVVACLVAASLVVAVVNELNHDDVTSGSGSTRKTTKIANQSDSYTIRGGLDALPSNDKTQSVANASAPHPTHGSYGNTAQSRNSDGRDANDKILYDFRFYPDGTCVITVDGHSRYGTWFEELGIKIYEIDGEVYTGYDDGYAFVTFFDGVEMYMPRA